MWQASVCFADARHSFSKRRNYHEQVSKNVLCAGLMVALASVAFAQGPAQSAGSKKMDSGCCACCSDSCDMTKQDAMKNHVASSSDQDGCCAGCGDSCDMKQKDAMKNHVTASDKHDCCACCGDSGDMKKKDALKNHVTSDKHEGCCCGDSCDMKTMKDMKKS